MRLKILILTLFFHHFGAFSQFQPEVANSIFIFTRSTAMKAAYIADDFNLKDSLSTHVGIGLKVDENYQIYNVTNEKKKHSPSALICENLESFIQVAGLQYYSVWEFKASSAEIDSMCKVLNTYLKLPITFDYDFVLQKDDALYCSEFVKIVLQEIDKEKFNFAPTKKELNGFYKNFLQRSTLVYIPVDFFLDLNCFELVEKKFYN